MVNKNSNSKKKVGTHLHGAKEIGNGEKQKSDAATAAHSMKKRGQANKKAA